MEQATTLTPETLRNRANAQHSTGPRTPEGKARSAANAVQHGLSGRTMIVRDDEAADHHQFLADWEHDLAPAGAAEKELFAQIVTAAWTLRRIARAEADLIDTSLHEDPLLASTTNATATPQTAIEKKLALFSLYQARDARAFHKSLAALRALQEERLFRESLPSASVAPPRSVLPSTAAVRRNIAQDKRTQLLLDQARLNAAFDALVPSPPSPPPPHAAARPDQYTQV